jgi:ABC-type transport system involved in resistance to organic solvents, periplasmic component
MGLSLTDRKQFQFVGLIAVVAVLLAGGLYVVLQPGGRTVTAYFTSASAVFEDNSVRMLGVPVAGSPRSCPRARRCASTCASTTPT